MSEKEKAASREFLSTAARIPPELRGVALEKVNTYLSGMADMAAIATAGRKEKENATIEKE